MPPFSPPDFPNPGGVGCDTRMKEYRFWQNSVEFKDGHQATLTIQSDAGRSDMAERIFVLQVLGAVRALGGWKFSFRGSPKETQAFVPGAPADMLDNGVPYWIEETQVKQVA